MARDKIKKPETKPTEKKTATKKKHYGKIVKSENAPSQATLKRGKVPNNWKTFIDNETINAKIIPQNLGLITKNGHSSGDSSKTNKKVNNAFIPTLPCIAIDCEMVGVGYKGKESMLARVSLVDENSKVVYDTFVQPMEAVTDYRTFVSGVRPHDMENGKPFAQVQEEVHKIVKDKILIGHALKHDLKALLLKHPQKLIRDTSKCKTFKEYCKGRTPGLKNLSEKLLGREIQKGEHSSVEDAKATMDLYIMFRNKIEYELKTRKFHKEVKTE